MMGSLKGFKLAAWGLMLSVLLTGLAQADTITFGVQAPRGSEKALKKWSELGRYLEAEIGQKVEIIPLKPNKTVDAMINGKVQFMLSNPVLAIVLLKKNSNSVLATLNKKSGKQFSGVIISKKGSGIKKAQDLKGKKVMAFKFKKSAAAYVFQIKHLKDKGINAHKDFKEFKEAAKQDDIVLAVKNGDMDAGFIKTGLMESMIKEGKVSWDDFDIVDKMDDGFAHVHTTALYPNWTVTAAPTVTKGVIERVKTALLKLNDSNKASKKAKIVGFVEPVSLQGLSTTLKELNLPPFN